MLERLSANNISVKITKCVWGTTQLPLLGHTIVAGEGVKPDMEKVRALTGKEKPTTVAALKSFNGAALYYKRFIECFAVWSKPLHTQQVWMTSFTSRDVLPSAGLPTSPVHLLDKEPQAQVLSPCPPSPLLSPPPRPPSPLLPPHRPSPSSHSSPGPRQACPYTSAHSSGCCGCRGACCRCCCHSSGS